MSMTSPADVLLGVQRPRVALVPPRVESAGAEAVDLALAAGLVLDPWQAWVLEQALGEREDGMWSAFEVALIVSRQNGKGSVLEALELAGLFLFGEKLILHSAHEFKTAREAFLRICALIENTDDLRKRCKKPRTSHGEEGVELLNGNRLNFVARSTGSGRGFTGDRIILDEAYKLSADAMAALLPTMSAKSMTGNPQIWYTSSAGMVSSTHLQSLRRRALQGESKRLAYLEWSAPPEARDDPGNREYWALANPALNVRISSEFVESELEALPTDEFCRERLGLFDDDGSEGNGIPGWQRVVADDVCPGARVAFGLDVNPERTLVSLGVSDGSNCELVEPRPTIANVVEMVAAAAKAQRAPVGVDMTGPAAVFADDLEARGVAVERFTGAKFAQACAAFYDAVVEERVRVKRHPAVDGAVAGARRQVSGDTWKWARRSSSVDISPLVAVTIAARLAAQTVVAPRVVNLADLLDDDDWS